MALGMLARMQRGDSDQGNVLTVLLLLVSVLLHTLSMHWRAAQRWGAINDMSTLGTCAGAAMADYQLCCASQQSECC